MGAVLTAFQRALTPPKPKRPPLKSTPVPQGPASASSSLIGRARQAAMNSPENAQGFQMGSKLTPLQARTALATKGVNQGLSTEEADQYRRYALTATDYTPIDRQFGRLIGGGWDFDETNFSNDSFLNAVLGGQRGAQSFIDRMMG